MFGIAISSGKYLAQFPNTGVKFQKKYPEKCLIFFRKKILPTFREGCCSSCKIKKFLYPPILCNDCWFSLSSELFKPKGKIFFCACLKNSGFLRKGKEIYWHDKLILHSARKNFYTFLRKCLMLAWKNKVFKTEIVFCNY